MNMKRHLEFEYVPTELIIPAGYNPRTITDENFRGLCESIKEYGILDALVVNKNNKTLIGGHKRLDAAIAVGLKEVPVQWVSLTSAHERVVNLILNNKKIQGQFTKDIFELVEEIKQIDPDIALEKFRLSDYDLGDLVPEHLLDNWDSDLDLIAKIDAETREMFNTFTIVVNQDHDLEEIKNIVKEALHGKQCEIR